MRAHLVVFVLALLMMGGSLYVGTFGDPVANIISGNLFDSLNALAPCTMCRYIRMSSYPLVIISGLNLWYRQTSHLYLLKAFTRLTFLSTSYKYYLEMAEINSSFCLIGVPCSDPGLLYAGFITLSFLGICCSVVMLVALYFLNVKKP